MMSIFVSLQIGRVGGNRTPIGGFGDRCTAIVLLPYWVGNLLRFLVRRVLAAVRAELHLLQALGRRLLVPSRRVVPFLALAAGQYRKITHCCTSNQ